MFRRVHFMYGEKTSHKTIAKRHREAEKKKLTRLKAIDAELSQVELAHNVKT